MDLAGSVPLTRLALLWTAGLALCAVSLREQIFILPGALVVSAAVCIGLMCCHVQREVWTPFAAVIAGAFVLVALGQFWLYANSQLEGVWVAPLLITWGVMTAIAALGRWRARLAYFAFLVVHSVLLVVMLREIAIVADVQALVEGGAEALLRGESPYAITVPAVYSADHNWIYGEGVLVNGRIMFGYPYLPAPLLVVIPGYLMGDIRMVLVLSMIATSIIVRTMASDWLGRLASVLILVMPVSWVVNLHYWIEPVALLFVALLTASMARQDQGRPVSKVPGLLRHGPAVWFGCLLASKQYAVVWLPFLWMLVRRRGRGAMAVSLAVPAALCMIFLVWDPQAFWHSAVDFHLRQPLRYDTVTLTPAILQLVEGSPAVLFGPYGFVLGFIVSTLLAWRCRPSASSLGAGIGLSLAVSVLFSKQGHPNYWGLIGCSLLIAVATYANHPWHTSAPTPSNDQDARLAP